MDAGHWAKAGTAHFCGLSDAGAVGMDPGARQGHAFAVLGCVLLLCGCSTVGHALFSFFAHFHRAGGDSHHHRHDSALEGGGLYQLGPVYGCHAGCALVGAGKGVQFHIHSFLPDFIGDTALLDALGSGAPAAYVGG